MKVFGKLFLPIFQCFVLLGCASGKFIFQSQPPGAKIYHLKGEKKNEIGITPFEISDEELRKKIDISSGSIAFLDFSFEKDGFENQHVLVPGQKMGTLSTEVYIKLEEAQAEKNLAKKMVKYLFNAQTFAKNGDFIRAHEEIDQLLKMDESFSRAISMKGAIYYLEKKYSESLSWYERALKVDSQAAEVIEMISRLRGKLSVKQQ